MKITLNRCKCRNCGDIIVSKTRHDFVMCSCQSIFTDGGNDYVRRGGDPDLIEDMSEYEPEPDLPVGEHLHSA